MKIFHAANIYLTSNADEAERNRRAQNTWSMLYRSHSSVYVPAYCTPVTLRRSASTELGDQRDLPFVKDIVDYACRQADPATDSVMLTNADSQLAVETIQILTAKLFHREAVWCHRLDMDKIYRMWLPLKEIKNRGERSAGVDLIAFRVDWWKNCEFPDLILGCEGWDWIFRFLIGDAGELDQELVYHEIHTPIWHTNRTISPAQLHNRKLCLDWANSRPDADRNRIRHAWPSLKEYEMDR